LVLFGIVSIGLLFLFSDSVAVLNPKGMIGQKQNRLLLLSTLVMLFVVIPTFVMTFFIVWKYRASNKDAKYSPDWHHNTLAEAIWWGFPLVIILILSVLTWNSCHELDPFRPIESDKKPVKIQVVALQWKWLFIYPEQGIASVNFMQIPEKTPIAFEISADAPMNSFWIPELGGQVYAMAGMRSKLALIADGIGTYRGSSANISGKGFSGMSFAVKSSSQGDFDQWVSSASSSAPLTRDMYKQLVEPSSYNAAMSYSLTESALFDWIVMKYMMPMKGKEHD
jgi:cytochrome o ubiquinol oxidase subunit 2